MTMVRPSARSAACLLLGCSLAVLPYKRTTAARRQQGHWPDHVSDLIVMLTQSAGSCQYAWLHQLSGCAFGQRTLASNLGLHLACITRHAPTHGHVPSLQPAGGRDGAMERAQPSQVQAQEEQTPIMKWLNPPKDELPNDFDMPIWDHLDELRERVLLAALAAAVAVMTCFAFSKELVVFLEAPVIREVRHVPRRCPVTCIEIESRSSGL